MEIPSLMLYVHQALALCCSVLTTPNPLSRIPTSNGLIKPAPNAAVSIR